MSVLQSPDSVYGKEAWKWEHHTGETHPSDPTIHGMRPREFQAFPAMLYRATQKNPWKFDEHVAMDAVDQAFQEAHGFVAGGKGAAAARYDAMQQEMAVLAAHRNYEDRNMSEAALAESNAAEQASSKHLAVIPEAPRRGRPRKIVE